MSTDIRISETLNTSDSVEKYIEANSHRDENGAYVFDYAAATIAIRGLARDLARASSRYSKLCLQVRKTLGLQKTYFKTNRHDDMLKAKEAEAELAAMTEPRQISMKI